MSEHDNQVLTEWNDKVDLFKAYEDMLSPTQRQILSLYFDYNLSVTEIAQERGITRAAAYDALKKGMAKLVSYEERLHLVKIDGILHRIEGILKEREELEKDEELAKLLKEANDDGI